MQGQGQRRPSGTWTAPPRQQQRPWWQDEPRWPSYDQRRSANDHPPFPELMDGGPRPDIAPLEPPVIPFTAGFEPRSIVIDVGAKKLYFVLPQSRAYAYDISVGREGFSWTGTETVSRKQDWPDWYPPAEMRERDPKLPVKMTGGIRNPLGAMALYLGTTLYRIHGTNDEKSIGRAESSGCFRMMNASVLHLAALTDIGTRVTVVAALPGQPEIAAAPPPAPRQAARLRADERWRRDDRPRYDDRWRDEPYPRRPPPSWGAPPAPWGWGYSYR
jgi:lipoprotein-anchoring transpeptidase ErfK/SrfK